MAETDVSYEMGSHTFWSINHHNWILIEICKEIIIVEHIHKQQ